MSPTPNSLPPIFHRSSPQTSILPILLPLLPASLPIVRLLQHRPISPTAHLLATFPPSEGRDGEEIDERGGRRGEGAEDDLWTVMYLDRGKRPGTEAWVFSSYECCASGVGEVGVREGGGQQQQQRSPSPSRHGTGHSESIKRVLTPEQTILRSHLLALLYAVANLPSSFTFGLPSTSSSDAPSLSTLGPDQGSVSHPILVMGSVHECLIPSLLGEEPWPEVVGVIGRDQPGRQAKEEATINPLSSLISDLSPPYGKWLIPPPPPSPPHSSPSTTSPPPSSPPPPPGFHPSPIPPSSLPTLIPKSPIPRSITSLATAPSISLRSSTTHEIQSFGFLSTDGSLMHLYTEPESRGRGLAGWVAGALVGGLVGGGRGKGDGEGKSRGEKGEGGEDGKGWFEGAESKDAWVASDVGVGNRGSERVAEGLGGRMGWRVRWLGVDLGKVRGIVEGMKKGL